MLTLGLVGLLYILSGLWCLAMMQTVLSFLGMNLQSGLAHSEYISVYGGLQLGLGLAMVLCARIPRYVEAALLFAAVFSLVLFVARLTSVTMYDYPSGALGLAVLEFILAAVLWTSWIRCRGSHDSSHAQ